MFSYIVQEIPELLKEISILDLTKMSIMGHSMGGCGALMIACLKSEMFNSMSAIAPRCSPSDPGAGWAKSTYQSLLGDDLLTQQSYDPVCLM